MQTLNPAYQIALTKARKFSASIMNELEAKADTPLLIRKHTTKYILTVA
jgi:hypothetical protein